MAENWAYEQSYTTTVIQWISEGTGIINRQTQYAGTFIYEQI